MAVWNLGDVDGGWLEERKFQAFEVVLRSLGECIATCWSWTRRR